ncbi:MAG: hypothetical protein ACFE89_02750 [Candidatus Hodarchaeota archaeon]
MFSEKTAPISELIKGTPDRSLREPALVILACLFNGFQIYRIFQILPQLSGYSPFGEFFYAMIAGMLGSLLLWYVIYSVILLIGGAIVYLVNQRIGSAVILVISIIGLLMSFMGMSVIIIFTFNTMDAIIGLLAPIIGVITGIYGVRSQRSRSEAAVHEVI